MALQWYGKLFTPMVRDTLPHPMELIKATLLKEGKWTLCYVMINHDQYKEQAIWFPNIYWEDDKNMLPL